MTRIPCSKDVCSGSLGHKAPSVLRAKRAVGEANLHLGPGCSDLG